jgi:AraC-like DNA-binding protein
MSISFYIASKVELCLIQQQAPHAYFFYSIKIKNMKLYIKNMVSLRCIIMVQEVLKKQGFRNAIVDLGMVEIVEDITEEQREQLKRVLLRIGLDLIDDTKTLLIEKIKKVVIEMVHCNDELPKLNYSDYISKKLGYNYTYLANIFSELKGISIRQYIINLRIEKVKELLLYDELNITEISFELHYSSVAHLSNQFKKVTGTSPLHYKTHKLKRECSLENV